MKDSAANLSSCSVTDRFLRC